jgi:hypothetical protein
VSSMANLLLDTRLMGGNSATRHLGMSASLLVTAALVTPSQSKRAAQYGSCILIPVRKVLFSLQLISRFSTCSATRCSTTSTAGNDSACGSERWHP